VLTETKKFGTEVVKTTKRDILCLLHFCAGGTAFKIVIKKGTERAISYIHINTAESDAEPK